VTAKLIAPAHHPREAGTAVAVSGFVILMAHPRLYWGEIGNDLTPALLELPVSHNHRPEGWQIAGTFSELTGPPGSGIRPYEADLCNAIRVQTSQSINYMFAPSIGIKTGTTGPVQSVTCFGECKRRGSPLDVALVLDRTASMTPADIQAVKDAAKEPKGAATTSKKKADKAESKASDTKAPDSRASDPS